MIQLNVGLLLQLRRRRLGAAQCAARLERVSVIAAQTPVVVVHIDHAVAVVIVVRQSCHIVVVAVKRSPARRIAMHQGQPSHPIAQRQCGRGRSGCRTGWHIVIQWQRVVRVVVYVAGIADHRIAWLGIDGSVVIEVILGESDPSVAIGKRLAVVRQGALLHATAAVARCSHVPWQRGVQTEASASVGQQPHVLLRVMRSRCGSCCSSGLWVVGHVVNVAELGEGCVRIDGAGHLQLLQGCSVC